MGYRPGVAKLLLMSSSEPLRDRCSVVLRSAGFDVVAVADLAGARHSLRLRRCDVLLVDFELRAEVGLGALRAEFDAVAGAHVKMLALVRGGGPEQYRALFEGNRLSNFVAVGDDASVDAGELCATVGKILSGDIFGIEKYLGMGAKIERFELANSRERAAVIDRAEDYARELGCHPRMAEQVAVATDELATNALYNSPVDSAGTPLFAHLPRSTEISLPAGRAVVLELGSDGRILALAARDPFGSLAPALVLDYLARCFSKDLVQTSERSGGAGLGLFYLFRLLHGFVINVTPGVCTESIGLLEVSRSFRTYAGRGRSFNIFVNESQGNVT